MALNKENFFSISLGNIIVLVVYLITGGIYVGKQQTLLSNQQRQINELIQRVDQIDQSGSRFISSIPEKLINLDTRVTRMEEYVPKIVVLSTDFKNLYDLVKEIKDDIKELNRKTSTPK